MVLSESGNGTPDCEQVEKGRPSCRRDDEVRPRDGSGGGTGADSLRRMNKHDVLMNNPPAGLPMPPVYFYMMEYSLFPIQSSLQNLFLNV